MKLFLVILLLIIISLFFSISKASDSGKVTIELNASKVWWNDSIMASGVAKYLDGGGIRGTVELEVDGIHKICPETDENGEWSCVFNAPTKIGSFIVRVTITNSTGQKFQNLTYLIVSPSYGRDSTGSKNKVVHELPVLIQDLDGEIKAVLARIMVWRD